MFIGNKKCRIYAACGVSQTPNIRKIERGVRRMFRRVNKDEAIRNNWPCIFCDEWSHDFIH